MEFNINIENNKYLDPKVVGIGILENNNQILLVKRGIEPGYGKWSMPSGFINRFEKVENAIERELLEECGITVKASWISGVYSENESPIILLDEATSSLDTGSEEIVQNAIKNLTKRILS